MSKQVDLYNSTYGNFQERVLAEIRRDTYGEDIGQNSWISTEEYDSFPFGQFTAPTRNFMNGSCNTPNHSEWRRFTSFKL